MSTAGVDTVIREAISKDVSNVDQIRRFLNLKTSIDNDKKDLVEGSLGLDVLSLYEGMKVPAGISNQIYALAKADHGVLMNFMPLLVGDDVKMVLEYTRNGFILTSLPDPARTRAIRRWAENSAYREDPRGIGFASAVTRITDLSICHFETYSLYSQAAGVMPTVSPLAMKIANSHDWIGIWKIYNKLIYGVSSHNKELQDRGRRLGLDNITNFEKVISRSRTDFLALEALQLLRSRLG